MKIVIDCNVLISAGLTDGTCRKVLIYTLQKCEIYTSEEILLEYLLVIRRPKFKKYIEKLEDLIQLYADASIIKSVTDCPYKLPDPEDTKYLSLALDTQSHYLITGNISDFPNKKYDKTKIVLPRDFYNQVIQKQEKYEKEEL